MHHKVFVVDDRYTVFGSFNFSDNADRSNDENLLIVDDPGFAQAFVGHADFNHDQAAHMDDPISLSRYEAQAQSTYTAGPTQCRAGNSFVALGAPSPQGVGMLDPLAPIKPLPPPRTSRLLTACFFLPLTPPHVDERMPADRADQSAG